jgi:hypothetical protein
MEEIMTGIKFYLMIFFSFWVLIPGFAEAAERVEAHVQCEMTDIRLAYDCQIMLMGKESGKPIEEAKFEVGADMPSMPMAHNVRPVKAMPGKKPGTYHVRIQLEMYGEWALKIDLKEPWRDRLIHKLHFGNKGTVSHDHKKTEN